MCVGCGTSREGLSVGLIEYGPWRRLPTELDTVLEGTEDVGSYMTGLNARALAAASMLALTAAGAAHADSLRDAIAAAYAQNPTLAKARAQQRETDEGYVQARSALGPAVNAQLGANYTREPSYLGGNSSIGSGSLALNQTVFSSGNLSSTLTAAQDTVKAGQEQLRSTEATVLYNVISVYTLVRRDQEALQISQQNYDTLKKQLDQTQAQFEAGQLTRTDVAQSQASVSQAEAALAQAQATLDSDRATYVQVVGQAPTALDPEPALPGLPLDFNAALQAAQDNNPDLGASLYAQASAHAFVGEARSAFGPHVALSASSTNLAALDHLGTQVNETTAGLTLSIPLYASGMNSSRLREALEAENAAKAQVDITRRQVTASVAQAWSQMLAAKSATASNEAQVKAAQTAFEGTHTEQQVGLRTNLDVLIAQQNLNTAQLQLIDARRQQYVAAAALLQVTGSLTARTLAPDAEIYDPNKNFKKVKNKGWTPVEPVVHALDSLAAPK